MSDVLKKAHYDPEIGFAYDPESGRLWRVHEVETTAERSYDDRIVARKLNCIGNVGKIVTHIMWKIMTGDWPTEGMYVDHEDGIVDNMEWTNLREATPQQNSANRASPGRWNNAHLPMEIGVLKEGNRFAVSIGQVYYGRFDTIEEANALAIAKRAELYGSFVRRT